MKLHSSTIGVIFTLPYLFMVIIFLGTYFDCPLTSPISDVCGGYSGEIALPWSLLLLWIPVSSIMGIAVVIIGMALNLLILYWIGSKFERRLSQPIKKEIVTKNKLTRLHWLGIIIVSIPIGYLLYYVYVQLSFIFLFDNPLAL